MTTLPRQPQRRLVAKNQSRANALTVLMLKSHTGFERSSIMASGEELAAMGLRPCQIEYLTDLPQMNANRLVEAVGRRCRTGRRRTSLADIYRNPRVHLALSVFLGSIEKQLGYDGSEVLTAAHVLAAYREFTIKLPSESTVDWERFVEAALSLVQGRARMCTCGVCNVRYLARELTGIDRSCVLCRLNESMTVVALRKSASEPMLRKVPCRTLPPVAGLAHKRKAALKAVLDTSSRVPMTTKDASSAAPDHWHTSRPVEC